MYPSRVYSGVSALGSSSDCANGDPVTQQGCFSSNASGGRLIVTPSGDWVFLELNPNGQWGWVEDMTQMDMSGAMVRLFRKQADETE